MLGKTICQTYPRSPEDRSIPLLLLRKLIHKALTHSGVWAIWGISGQGVFQPKRNGYSIAEIVVALSIVAAVLVGVLSMYTMVSEDAELRAVVAEVHLLQRAAQQYKREHGRYDQYMSIRNFSLKYYVGGENSDLGKGINHLGRIVSMTTGGTAKNMSIRYFTGSGPHALKFCVRVLRHFGTKIKPRGEGGTKIAPGKAIRGFISGFCNDPRDVASLILITE